MTPGFATTKWTVILAARDGTESQARRALEELCTAYWYPLGAYARRRGDVVVPAELQALLAALLVKDRDRRISHAGNLITALRVLLAGDLGRVREAMAAKTLVRSPAAGRPLGWCASLRSLVREKLARTR